MKHALAQVRVALGCCLCVAACGGRLSADGGGFGGMGGRSPMGDTDGGAAAGEGGPDIPQMQGSGGAIGSGNAGGAGGEAGDVPGVATGTAGADAGQGGMAGQPTGAGGDATDAGGSSGLPASCREVPTEMPDGDYLVDPNGGDPDDAFAVTCDLTTDGGRWTLIGRGQWWVAEANALPAGIDAYLAAAKRTAIVRVSSALFRAGAGTQRLFIKDSNALLESGFHYWRTLGAGVACTTDYANVDAGTMAITTSMAMSCDTHGVGSHTCGTLNGWLLLHLNDTYNVSGAHPCSLGSGDLPTAAGLRTLWVR